MALNLNEFLSEIREGGVHPLNRFQVDITAPPGLNLDQRGIALRASSVVFPGRTLLTKDDTLRFGYGLIDKVVHNTTYSDVPIAFIIDGGYKTAKVFHDWMTLIVDAATDDQPADGKYLIEYKDTYAATIEITQFNTLNNPTVKCTLNQAFPTMIQDTQLGWDQNNQITILPVNFMYNNYKIKTFDSTDTNPDASASNGGLESVVSGLLRRPLNDAIDRAAFNLFR